MGPSLHQARLFAGEFGGGRAQHQEDGAVGKFLYEVRRRREHPLSSYGLDQFRAEDVQPRHFLNPVAFIPR